LFLKRRVSESRRETVMVAGREYRPGEAVSVRVVHRADRMSVTDEGVAVDRAGRAPGWRGVADRLGRELDVNVSRHGVVSLPVVAVGPGLDAIARRIGEASLTLYQELLELQS
jgi:hypothetical protein